jgi:hypothetical protein
MSNVQISFSELRANCFDKWSLARDNDNVFGSRSGQLNRSSAHCHQLPTPEPQLSLISPSVESEPSMQGPDQLGDPNPIAKMPLTNDTRGIFDLSDRVAVAGFW